MLAISTPDPLVSTLVEMFVVSGASSRVHLATNRSDVPTGIVHGVNALWLAPASVMAAAHVALIVVLVAGGPITLRHGWFAWVHLPALAATAVVFLARADCPLTVWQKSFLSRAGRTPYRGGFIEHYIVEPIAGHAMTPATSMAIVAAWLVPTAVSYVVLARR
jgi:hypothetical protein